MLELGDKVNDSTQFIEFMLKVILEAVSEFSDRKTAENVVDILDDKMIDKLNNKELEFFHIIYPYLKENEGIANRKASMLSGRNIQTARRYLLKFVRLGILTTTGENKNRKYVLL